MFLRIILFLIVVGVAAGFIFFFYAQKPVTNTRREISFLWIALVSTWALILVTWIFDVQNAFRYNFESREAVKKDLEEIKVFKDTIDSKMSTLLK